MNKDLTDLEVNLLKEIRRVRSLGLSQPANSPMREHCDEEVRRSVDAFALADERRMDERLFHLERVRLYDTKLDALPADICFRPI